MSIIDPKTNKREWERMDAAWDRMSADYGERLRLSPADEHYHQLAGQLPATEQPLRLLDLGTGLGYQLDAIFERMPNLKVTSLDVSSQMLEKLRARLKPYASQIETRCESYVEADFGEALYHYAISSLTVHHLPRPTKLALFRQIRRALKPGGLYLELDDVATTPEQEAVGTRDYEKFIAQREGGVKGEWNHNMNFTVETECAVLEEAGYSRVEVPWRITYQNGYSRALFVCAK